MNEDNTAQINTQYDQLQEVANKNNEIRDMVISKLASHVEAMMINTDDSAKATMVEAKRGLISELGTQLKQREDSSIGIIKVMLQRKESETHEKVSEDVTKLLKEISFKALQPNRQAPNQGDIDKELEKRLTEEETQFNDAELAVDEIRQCEAMDTKEKED